MFGREMGIFAAQKSLKYKGDYELTMEDMLQKPAGLCEILGHSQLHARSQIPAQTLHILYPLVNTYPTSYET